MSVSQNDWTVPEEYYMTSVLCIKPITQSGFSNLAGTQRKSPATSSICVR